MRFIPPGYSDGMFCRVFFAICDGELRTYTWRSRQVTPAQSLIDVIVFVLDDREFHQRFIDTAFLPPAA